MNKSAPYENLRPRTFQRRVPGRAIAVAVAALMYVLLVRLVPEAGVRWITFFVLLIAVWAASYGWRDAVRSLIRLMHRLEQL